MGGAVFLEGEEVELRTLEKDDAERLRDIANHPEVRKYIGVRAPLNLLREEKLIEEETENDEHLMFAIHTGGEIIGSISLKKIEPQVAELGIMIDPGHHGKGYGTEASRMLVEHAFKQLNHHKLYAWVFETNQKSARVWEKLGFRQEAELDSHFLMDGEFKKAYIYGLLKGEWN